MREEQLPLTREPDGRARTGGTSVEPVEIEAPNEEKVEGA